MNWELVQAHAAALAANGKLAEIAAKSCDEGKLYEALMAITKSEREIENALRAKERLLSGGRAGVTVDTRQFRCGSRVTMTSTITARLLFPSVSHGLDSRDLQRRSPTGTGGVTRMAAVTRMSGVEVKLRSEPARSGWTRSRREATRQRFFRRR